MWILFVLVATFSSVNVARVDMFVHQTACTMKKAQLEQEFQLAYPGDKDWAFVCVFVPHDTPPHRSE